MHLGCYTTSRKTWAGLGLAAAARNAMASGRGRAGF